jgi:hypothetical protein
MIRRYYPIQEFLAKYSIPVFYQVFKNFKHHHIYHKNIILIGVVFFIFIRWKAGMGLFWVDYKKVFTLLQTFCMQLETVRAPIPFL